MKCPACGQALTEKQIGELRAEACEGGCGGVWFDCFEPKKVRKEDEPALAALRYLKRNRRLIVDFSQNRVCPHCADTSLKRVLFGPGSRANVSECPRCGGCWLDDGELAQLHFEWSQSKDAEQTDETSDASGLMQYLYELRTGHSKQ